MFSCCCGKYNRIKFRGIYCELCNSFVWGAKSKKSHIEEALNGFYVERNLDLRFIPYPKRAYLLAEDAIRHYDWLKRITCYV